MRESLGIHRLPIILIFLFIWMGCITWMAHSMLKGQILSNVVPPADLVFMTPNTASALGEALYQEISPTY